MAADCRHLLLTDDEIWAAGAAKAEGLPPITKRQAQELAVILAPIAQARREAAARASKAGAA